MNVLIKDIPDYEKPRERLINYGQESLSNEELIAIILRSGTKNYSSKYLANLILKEYKDISELKNASINKLCNIKGIGKTKAIELLAAIELGKRVFYFKNKKDIIFNSTEKIYDFFKYEFVLEKQERFYVIFLDTKCKLISYKNLFTGSVNISNVHPREIFKEAFNASASSIICIHNHPSGDVTPSTSDIEITKSLMKIGKIMGIEVLDHIIIGNDKYYSFYEKMNK
jgi:DNA repair protein RadC